MSTLTTTAMGVQPPTRTATIHLRSSHAPSTKNHLNTGSAVSSAATANAASLVAKPAPLSGRSPLIEHKSMHHHHQQQQQATSTGAPHHHHHQHNQHHHGNHHLHHQHLSVSTPAPSSLSISLTNNAHAAAAAASTSSIANNANSSATALLLQRARSTKQQRQMSPYLASVLNPSQSHLKCATQQAKALISPIVPTFRRHASLLQQQTQTSVRVQLWDATNAKHEMHLPLCELSLQTLIGPNRPGGRVCILSSGRLVRLQSDRELLDAALQGLTLFVDDWL